MTESELNNYKFLVKEAERLRKIIDETTGHEYIAYKSPVLTGLPRGNQTSDSTFKAVVNVPKERESMSDKYQFVFRLQSIERRIINIENFIYSIPDDKTRIVFQYKYLDGMSNVQIGDELNYVESNIRKIIKEYLKSAKSAKSACYNITMEQ